MQYLDGLGDPRLLGQTPGPAVQGIPLLLIVAFQMIVKGICVFEGSWDLVADLRPAFATPS